MSFNNERPNLWKQVAARYSTRSTDIEPTTEELLNEKNCPMSARLVQQTNCFELYRVNFERRFAGKNPLSFPNDKSLQPIVKQPLVPSLKESARLKILEEIVFANLANQRQQLPSTTRIRKFHQESPVQIEIACYERPWFQICNKRKIKITVTLHTQLIDELKLPLSLKLYLQDVFFDYYFRSSVYNYFRISRLKTNFACIYPPPEVPMESKIKFGNCKCGECIACEINNNKCK
jgi:hypothetical protein